MENQTQPMFKNHNYLTIIIVALVSIFQSCTKKVQKNYKGKYSNIIIDSNGVSFVSYMGEESYVNFFERDNAKLLETKFSSTKLIDTCLYINDNNYYYKYYVDSSKRYVVSFFMVTQICDSFLLRFIIRKNIKNKFGVYAIDTIKPKTYLRRYLNYYSINFYQDLNSVIKNLKHIDYKSFMGITEYFKIKFINDSVEEISGIKDYTDYKSRHPFESEPDKYKALVTNSMYFIQYSSKFHYPPYLQENWLPDVLNVPIPNDK